MATRTGSPAPKVSSHRWPEDGMRGRFFDRTFSIADWGVGSAEWKKRGDRRGVDRIFGRRALLRPSRPEPWEGWHGDCCPQTMEGLGLSGFLHCACDWFAARWVFGTSPDALGCPNFVTSFCDENVTFFRLRGCGRSGILPTHRRGEAFVLPAAQVVGGKGSSPGTIPDRGFEMERTE